MRTEQIGLHAEAIEASRHLIALPTPNHSIGPTLEIIGFEKQGYGLVLTDAAGALVWRVMLNAEGGVNGPRFGADEGSSDGR